MTRTYPWVASGMALAGIVIGSILTQQLIESRQKDSEFGRLRAEAYQEFFQMQADYKIAKQIDNDEERTAADYRLYQNRLKMIVFASKDTIMRIVDYWTEYYPTSGCSDSVKRIKDASIFEQMRKETFEAYDQHYSPLEKRTVVRFLYKCDLE